VIPVTGGSARVVPTIAMPGLTTPDAGESHDHVPIDRLWVRLATEPVLSG